MADDLELRIARLELAPGDVLVVKSAMQPAHHVLAAPVTAGARVLYITPEVELSVLTKAEIEARAVG